MARTLTETRRSLGILLLALVLPGFMVARLAVVELEVVLIRARGEPLEQHRA